MWRMLNIKWRENILIFFLSKLNLIGLKVWILEQWRGFAKGPRKIYSLIFSVVFAWFFSKGRDALSYVVAKGTDFLLWLDFKLKCFSGGHTPSFFSRVWSSSDVSDGGYAYWLNENHQFVNTVAYLKGFIFSPEFYGDGEWVRFFTDVQLNSNLYFWLALDDGGKIFLIIKIFSRYGFYMAELFFFSLLIFSFFFLKKTRKLYNLIMYALIFFCLFHFCLIFTQFSPAELVGGYKGDSYGVIIKFIFLFFLTFYTSNLSYYEYTGKVRKELYILYLFFILFNLMLISCSDLWLFFFSLEGVSFCVIIYFIFNFSGKHVVQNSIRYFCLNAASSGCFLASIGITAHITSSTRFFVISDFVANSPALGVTISSFKLVGVLFLIGSFFKLSIFPFNLYLVDTYLTSSYNTIYFFGLISKIPFVYVWFKLSWRVIPLVKVYFPAVLIFGLATAIVGTLGAFAQNSIRSFLAYSSMGHMGFVLVSFATETNEGIMTAFFYFFAYSLSMTIIFMLLVALSTRNVDLHGLHQLRELRASRGVVWCFSIAILNLAGFPLTAGFFAKLSLITNLVSEGQNGIAWIILLLNIISFTYYLRILRTLWIEPYDAKEDYHGAIAVMVRETFQNRALFSLFFLAGYLCLFVFVIDLTFGIVYGFAMTLYASSCWVVTWPVFMEGFYFTLTRLVSSLTLRYSPVSSAIYAARFLGSWDLWQTLNTLVSPTSTAFYAEVVGRKLWVKETMTRIWGSEISSWHRETLNKIFAMHGQRLRYSPDGSNTRPLRFFAGESTFKNYRRYISPAVSPEELYKHKNK